MFGKAHLSSYSALTQDMLRKVMMTIDELQQSYAAMNGEQGQCAALDCDATKSLGGHEALDSVVRELAGEVEVMHQKKPTFRFGNRQAKEALSTIAFRPWSEDAEGSRPSLSWTPLRPFSSAWAS